MTINQPAAHHDSRNHRPVTNPATALAPTTAAIIATLLAFVAPQTTADELNDELGAWTMYFWNTDIGEGNWVAQGDLQYRQWSVGDDTEQILLRGALGYRPGGGRTVLAGGYAFIRSKPFGPGGTDVDEDRIYQEALIPQGPLGRFHLTHRLRAEQRWVDNQDFRTRYRYALFANVPLNRETLSPGSIYLAFYNEVFINGERDIGNNRKVDWLDRNRLYGGLGYTVAKGARLQFGIMRQSTSSFDKHQLQFSFHHSF